MHDNTTLTEEVMKEQSKTDHENRKLACNTCEYISNDEGELKEHIHACHSDKQVSNDEEDMEIEVNEENKEGNKRERKCSTPNSNPSSPPNKKFLTDTPKHEEDVKHVNDTEERVKLLIDERTLKAKIVQLEEALEKVQKEQ